jgi:uncharacterized protein
MRSHGKALRGVISGLLGCVMALVALSGCSSNQGRSSRYHDGLLFLATGDTTGANYQFGGGYADLVTKYLSGYEMRAEPTGGDNIDRIASGDMDLALTTMDVASDAINGRGVFAGAPRRFSAVARLYDNTAQVVIRANSKVKSLADLRGKRVSTGVADSGTDILAERLLGAAGLDPDKDIIRVQLSLPETTKAMKAGTLDGFIYASGLPALGITDLLTSGPGQYTFVPTGDLLSKMNSQYENEYQATNIPKEAYGTVAEIPSITVPSMLLVANDVPEQVVYDLTRVLWEHQAELATAHPDGTNFTLGSARLTEPVSLHPGAKRYYEKTK